MRHGDMLLTPGWARSAAMWPRARATRRAVPLSEATAIRFAAWPHRSLLTHLATREVVEPVGPCATQRQLAAARAMPNDHFPGVGCARTMGCLPGVELLDMRRLRSETRARMPYALGGWAVGRSTDIGPARAIRVRSALKGMDVGG